MKCKIACILVQICIKSNLLILNNIKKFTFQLPPLKQRFYSSNRYKKRQSFQIVFFIQLFLRRINFAHCFLGFFIHFHFNIVVHHHIHINGDAFLWCIQLNGRRASRECKHRRKNKKVRLKFKVFYHLSLSNCL